MPAGGLHILSLGGREEYPLTSSPEFTYFKTVVKKHTRFAVDEIPILFSGAIAFGQRITARLPRVGHFLRDIYLEIQLPILPTTMTGGSQPSYINGIGHAMIEYISIEIGEKEIDRLDSNWLDFYAESTEPLDRRDTFNELTGRFPPFATAIGPYVHGG
jgi:hypothetical protein